jgi:hypothetical protein
VVKKLSASPQIIFMIRLVETLKLLKILFLYPIFKLYLHFLNVGTYSRVYIYAFPEMKFHDYSRTFLENFHEFPRKLGGASI